MTTLDAATLTTLLHEVSNAARAAAETAKSTATSSQAAVWIGPNCCRNRAALITRAEEIRYFKDWSWQMIQYLSAINQGAFRLGSRAWETNGYGHCECIYERERGA